jgi:hypothetical protein
LTTHTPEPTTEATSLLGALVGWEIAPDFMTTRDAVRLLLAKHQLPAKLLRATLPESDAFVRAVRDVAAMVKPAGTKIEVTKVAQLCTENQTVYVIGTHGVDVNAARWQANEAKRFLYDRSQAGYDKFVSEDPKLQQPLLDGVMMHVNAVQKRDLVDLIDRAMAEFRTFGVESAGGSKFVPGMHIDSANLLGAFLKDLETLSQSGTCQLVVWPIANVEQGQASARVMFNKAAAKRLEDAKRIFEKIWEDEAAGLVVTDKRKKTALTELADAKAEIDFYVEAIKFNADEVMADMDAFTLTVADKI